MHNRQHAEQQSELVPHFTSIDKTFRMPLSISLTLPFSLTLPLSVSQCVFVRRHAHKTIC